MNADTASLMRFFTSSYFTGDNITGIGTVYASSK